MSKKKLAGIIVACVAVVAVAVVVATHLPLPFSDSPDLEESLRERATEWNNLLNSLRAVNLTPEQAVVEIEGFLEPSSNRTTVAQTYYWFWTGGWVETAWSIDDVSIDATNTTGTVRASVEFVWTWDEMEGVEPGDTMAQNQTTSWKLIGGVWYRTVEVAEVEQ
jgi:hypothetical protein